MSAEVNRPPAVPVRQAACKRCGFTLALVVGPNELLFGDVVCEFPRGVTLKCPQCRAPTPWFRLDG